MGTFGNRRSTLRSCCTTNGPPAGEIWQHAGGVSGRRSNRYRITPKDRNADNRQRATASTRCRARPMPNQGQRDLRLRLTDTRHLNRPVDGDVIWAPAIDAPSYYPRPGAARDRRSLRRFRRSQQADPNRNGPRLEGETPADGRGGSAMSSTVPPTLVARQCSMCTAAPTARTRAPHGSPCSPRPRTSTSARPPSWPNSCCSADGFGRTIEVSV
jgi:hypothetical protein